MRKTTPGINHIEFWTSDLQRTLTFYDPILKAIGWNKLGSSAFSSGSIEIYFIERDVKRFDSIGPRHICFQANSRETVDYVGQILASCPGATIRGPLEVTEYSEGYYTVDFRDPDGFVLEVAHTPHMIL